MKNMKNKYYSSHRIFLMHQSSPKIKSYAALVEPIGIKIFAAVE